jgi:stage III sporulation protein SpoIIIAA
MSRPISSDQRELASLEATSLFDAMQKLQEKASEELLANCLAKSMRAATEQRHSGEKPAPVHEKKAIQRFISAPLAKSGAVPSAAASPALSASTSATATLVTKILVKEPAAAPVPHRPAAAQSAHPVASATAATQPLMSGAPPAPQQHQQSALHQQQAQQHHQQQQTARVQVQKPPSPTSVTAVAVATAAIASPVVSRFMASSPLITSTNTSPRGPRPVADTNTDFAPIFAVLPPAMAAGIAERMPDFLSSLHSIAIDLGQCVTLTRLYQEPPVRLAEPVSEQELRHICDAIGAATLLTRQSAPIGESLHIAHALVDPASQQVTGLTLRVGRAVVGASDVLHDIVVSGKNVVLLGFGKTTLLRDIVARRSLNEQHVVMVLDSRGELGGLRAVAHPSLGHVRRVVPGREGQTGLIRASIEKHAAKVLAIDELWAHEDFVELRSHARIRGVQVIAGCPARDAAEFKALRPVADFDTVVEVLSPVSFRVSYLASNTTQLRMRTPQGVVIRDESL